VQVWLALTQALPVAWFHSAWQVPVGRLGMHVHEHECVFAQVCLLFSGVFVIWLLVVVVQVLCCNIAVRRCSCYCCCC